MDWNFAKVLLTVYRCGSVANAAPVLDMSESTLFRHLSAYEKEFGQLFFRNSRSSYTLTALGESLLNPAASVEALYGKISRELAKRDDLQSMQVNLTAPTSYSYYLIPLLTEALHREHPEIRINLKVTNSTLSLNAHEADIALRVSESPPSHYIGRKVANVGWSAFCGTPYDFKGKRPSSLQDLTEHRVIAGSGELNAMAAYKWVDQHCQEACMVATDDFVAMANMASRGKGIAILPDEFVLHPLKRLFPIKEFSVNSLWVLKHRDMRQIKRVRLVEKLLIKTVSECLGR